VKLVIALVLFVVNKITEYRSVTNLYTDEMNTNIEKNYAKVKLSSYGLPILLLLILFVFLYKQDAVHISTYIQFQKDWFYSWNAKLSQFSFLQYNLTQLGDAFVFLSLLSVLIVYAPKIWEELLTASILSALFSKVLKVIFAVPRPAAILDHDSFVIVGKPLMSHSSSLPSGHAITIFTVLTILMFGFLPKNLLNKISWIVGFIVIGLILAFTRVGIGAHFPLDVIIGSIVGYLSGITGIFINRKYKLWTWINAKKYYPFFIVLFVVSIVVMITKIEKDNVIIFYFSLISLIISLYMVVKEYVKKY
jgi:membrane-associated phospholipid phosphatase